MKCTVIEKTDYTPETDSFSSFSSFRSNSLKYNIYIHTYICNGMLKTTI